MVESSPARTGRNGIAALIGCFVSVTLLSLGLAALEDDQHYFPPYDAAPIVRESTLERFPQLRAALADLGGKISASDIRKLNYAVDAQKQDAAAAVRAFRAANGI